MRLENSICRCATGVLGSNRRSKSACHDCFVRPNDDGDWRSVLGFFLLLEDHPLAADVSSSRDASKRAKSSVSAACVEWRQVVPVGWRRKDLSDDDGGGAKAETTAGNAIHQAVAESFILLQVVVGLVASKVLVAEWIAAGNAMKKKN